MATQTQTESAPKVEVITEAKVDTTLKSLFIAEQQSYGKIVEHVKLVILPSTNNNLDVTRGIVKVTLMSARGLNAASAATTVTNIMNLVKPENESVLKDLLDGKITVAQSREQAKAGTGQGRQKSEKTEKPEPTPTEKYKVDLLLAANQALNTFKKDLQGFLADATEAFNAALETQKQIANAQAKTQGGFKAEPAPEAPATTATAANKKQKAA